MACVPRIPHPDIPTDPEQIALGRLVTVHAKRREYDRAHQLVADYARTHRRLRVDRDETNEPLGCLDLDVGTVALLASHGVADLGDLAEMTEDKLAALDGIGADTAARVFDAAGQAIGRRAE